MVRHSRRAVSKEERQGTDTQTDAAIETDGLYTNFKQFREKNRT